MESDLLTFHPRVATVTSGNVPGADVRRTGRPNGERSDRSTTCNHRCTGGSHTYAYARPCRCEAVGPRTLSASLSPCDSAGTSDSPAN